MFFKFRFLRVSCKKPWGLAFDEAFPNAWREAGIEVSVGLKCVRTSRIECVLNRSPWYTHVSKNVISSSEALILAVMNASFATA